MSAEELAEETAEFEHEFVADLFRPPSANERVRWERSRRARGRPPIGRGAKVISVSIEKELLERADGLARKKRITRASLISRGLKAVLAAEGL